MDLAACATFLSIVTFLMNMNASALQQGSGVARSEEYEVYSELLQLQRADSKWDRCAIQRETTLGDMKIACVRPKRNGKRYRAEIADFMAKARSPIRLANGFDPSLDCEVISEADAREAITALHAPPQTASHQETAMREPAFRHIFEFSAVGFNTARNRAVVYMGHDCPGMCGDGRFVALQKSDGQWKVDHAYKPECEGWVS